MNKVFESSLKELIAGRTEQLAWGFEPPWGKRKAPAFVSKAGTSYG